jgi:nitroreductase
MSVERCDRVDRQATDLALEIESRRSTTAWRQEKVSRDTWATLLEAARRAPSSWNHQPARYIVIDDDRQKSVLCRGLHRTNRWAEKAPGLIVQVARPEDDDISFGQPYYLFDCGLAMMSLVYQAQSMGISTRMMIGFDEADVRETIQLPTTYRIVVMAGLGYLSDSTFAGTINHLQRRVTGQNKRYAVEDIVSWQVWGGTSR